MSVPLQFSTFCSYLLFSWRFAHGFIQRTPSAALFRETTSPWLFTNLTRFIFYRNQGREFSIFFLIFFLRIILRHFQLLSINQLKSGFSFLTVISVWLSNWHCSTRRNSQTNLTKGRTWIFKSKMNWFTRILQRASSVIFCCIFKSNRSAASVVHTTPSQPMVATSGAGGQTVSRFQSRRER